MSVINKMLRDLDQRQEPDDRSSARPGAALLRSGTASVSGAPLPARAHSSTAALLAVAAVTLLAACGAAWWWLHQAPPAVPSVQAVAAVPSAVPSAAAASAPMPAPAQVPSPAPGASAPLAKPAAIPSSALPPLPLPTRAPVAVTSAVEVLAPGSAVAAKAPVMDAPTAGQRQQLAARDALAQAQSLWNAGAHDNAIELLQQAVVVTERSAQTSPGAPATQALASLARELARMQVAQGRPGAAVDWLARLEPLLAGEPEIWAVRANAAQRAGRHQESVNAYSAALQARPNEQRWLLGAAVSSAALGQSANAAALVEKAASVGPVPKEVQSYLRQLGVPVKD